MNRRGPFVHIEYPAPASVRLRVTIVLPVDAVEDPDELEAITAGINGQRNSLGTTAVDLELVVRPAIARTVVLRHVQRTIGSRFTSVRLG